LKILCVIPGSPEGNSMIFVKKLNAYLMERGINIREFYLASRVNPKVIVSEAIRCRREIRAYRPTVIHANYGSMTSFFCSFLSVLTKLPLIITFRGSDLNETDDIVGFWRSCVGKALSHISSLRARRIICVSRGLRQKLVFKKRADILTSPVNLERFKPIDRAKARQLLGWTNEGKTVLFNAGFSPEIKGLDFANRIMETVSYTLPAARLEVMNGEIPFSMMPTYMGAADCLLVLSRVEGSPNVIKEAMACNLPIVSVDVGDVRERLEGVNPSFIVERNIEEVSSALITLLSLGKRSNGRKLANAFSMDTICDQLLKIYCAL
jgi:teichuronic acid biosynthesis glycosyltransferase TuaC